MQLPSRLCRCDMQFKGKYENHRQFGNVSLQPNDGGQQLTATTSWTSLTITITGTASISNPGPYSTKTYWVVKPAGYSYVQFQYVSFSSTQTKFSPGCRDFGLEVKYQSNHQRTSPRVCSDAWNGLSSSSPLTTTPIVAYTSTISATFVLQFRATNTNVTDVKPPPPPFLSPTTSTSTSTSMPTTTTTTDPCFANSAPLAECAAQCPTGWDFFEGKCYQLAANDANWDDAAANCMTLCTQPTMCHLPRVYSQQQGKDLNDYSGNIGPWIDIRKIATDPTAWSRFFYGGRDESRAFAHISTSHDHYINPDLEYV
ncbi:hypothetical protein WR25_05242 [Diploscapter pachys]|uniref:C-type lectin domain-containing protein n=1 Tax=Diploscapter pachys TaxID=2018661 RepID=A0A2A2LR67_9BILA|nr:hypothetical protein WR25_05242 [Diploscapter pachys]